MCAKGASWASISFKHLQQNHSTGSFSLKLKKNIINNYNLQNYNSLFEKKKLADDNWLAD